jgi:hypothetical protein
MTLDEYQTELETIIEESGIQIRPKTVERLAKRSVQIEQDGGFDEEEISDELFEVLSKKEQADDDIITMVEDFSTFVFDNSQTDDIVLDED